MGIKTKFGNASIDKNGYYVIHNKPNRGKKLHRLIYEDFYRCGIPKGYVIHHKNGIKTDNCILNLQLMRESDHNKLHNTGENHPMFNKHHSDHAKQKISDACKGKKHDIDVCIHLSEQRNNTGYYRVSKIKCSECKQGFTWRYRYIDDEKVRRTIESVDIDKLQQKVLEKGLLWKKLN